MVRLGLVAIFALAGCGKLLDLKGSRAAVQGFGVPERLAGVVGTALPPAELLVAVALIADPLVQPAAVAALVLLAAFVAGMARVMRRGDQVDCHCFGAIHSAPVGRRTIARNLLLAATAVVVVVGGGGKPVSGWIGGLHGASLLAFAEGVLIAALLAAGAYVFARRRETPAIATMRAAPSFTVTGLEGGRATLESLLAPARPLLLLFTDPACGPCHALLPEVGRWQQQYAGKLSIAVISTGSADDNRAAASEHGLQSVYVQEARSVSQAFGVSATPGAVLVDPDGTVRLPVAAGADAIRELLPGAGPAAPLPQLLIDIDGEPIDLARGRGRTLLVFWNPGCGFCDKIGDELLEWELTRRKSDPRFVLIGSGAEAALHDLPFSAPVVFDEDGSLMRAFGAPGTPSAVLVESDGSVVAAVAVGGPDVLALAADRVPRREMIRGIGALVAAVSMLSPATAFGAKKHCPRGRRVCGSRCCPPGFTCKTGRLRGKTTKKCVCPKGRKLCGKKCVNLATDPKNCGACGKLCATGQTCAAGKCVGGTQQQPVNQQPAAPTCSDGVKNGNETDVDCGGPSCPKCADGKTCAAGSDCVSGVCTGGVCAQPAATCSDGRKNGSETDVDCGGPNCQQCANGKTCAAGTDCASGHCLNGVCRQCSTAGDCPAGATGDCQKAVCTAGVCGFAADDTDVPPEDGNPCTAQTCAAGVPAHPFLADGTDCGGGNFCSTGICVQCAQASDCPGSECFTPTCFDGACGGSNVAAGTVIAAQTAGDCKTAVCDGAGGPTQQNNDADVPTAPNDCYDATCTAGTPAVNPKATGVPCATGVCDGAGTCVQCLSPSDCPPPGDCHTAVCSGGNCGTVVVPDGTVCPTGSCTAGVCG